MVGSTATTPKRPSLFPPPDGWLEVSRELSTGLAQARTPKRKQELYDLVVKHEWGWAKVDPLYFLGWLAKTKDEHDARHPYKPFPEKLYNYYVVREWWKPQNGVRRLLIPKSRQVMVSWTFAGLYLWKCLSHQAQLCGIQTQKEDDAHDIVERGYGMWKRLPAVLKEIHPCKPKFCWLHFPNTESDFRGFPQGADQVRRLTFSEFWVDEGAYVDDLAGTLAAVLATLDEHSGLVISSSAKASFMQQLVEDQA